MIQVLFNFHYTWCVPELVELVIISVTAKQFNKDYYIVLQKFENTMGLVFLTSRLQSLESGSLQICYFITFSVKQYTTVTRYFFCCPHNVWQVRLL